MNYFPIKLDKTRNFKYGMRAISLTEKYFKTTITKVDFQNLTMEDAATLIWAGLQHEDKELTPDKVMDLIDEYLDIETIMKSVEEALNDAFGVNEEKN